MIIKLLVVLLYAGFSTYPHLKTLISTEVTFKLSFVMGRLAMGMVLADLLIG